MRNELRVSFIAKSQKPGIVRVVVRQCACVFDGAKTGVIQTHLNLVPGKPDQGLLAVTHSLQCGEVAAVKVASLLGPGACLRASKVYMVGTTNTVSSVPKLMPPTITQPI